MIDCCEKAQRLSRSAFFCSFLGIVFAQPGVAQNIALDGTLGPALELNGPTYEIQQDFGTAVGGNLFHSFESFSLSAGEAADFQSDLSIQNIFGRVTGGGRSSIDGELFTTSDTVNLFLINPNGILFGPNASLEIGGSERGSFIATTLDSLVWPNGSQFDAVAPADSQGLLNIVGDPSGFIASQRVIPGIEVFGEEGGAEDGIRVAAGQSLLLLGGEIEILDRKVDVAFPEGGRIELAGISEAGTVVLSAEGNDWSLALPEQLARADIVLNNATMNVEASVDGSLSIYGNNVEITESGLLAGIATDPEFAGAEAGDLLIDAQSTIRIQGESRVANDVSQDANIEANTGDLRLSAKTIEVIDGTQLSSSTFGRGKAGNVWLTADENIFFQNSNISTLVAEGTVGQAGNITLDAPVVEITDNSLLDPSTLGEGNAGTLRIKASDRVLFENSRVISDVDEEAIGQGGDIVIDTRLLEVVNNSLFLSQTQNRGDAGNINITASELVFLEYSNVTSRVDEDAVGRAGNIVIKAPAVEILDSLLDSSTLGQGDSKNIEITASEYVTLKNSRVTSDVDRSKARGQGGNIVIKAPILQIFNGQLIASTSGDGDAGEIRIDAIDRVILEGQSSILTVNTQVLREDGEGLDFIVLGTGLNGTGQGGDIDINTPQLLLNERSIIRASTFNDQSGGDIRLNLRSLEVLDGGQILTTSEPRGNDQGKSGDINIRAAEKVQIGGFVTRGKVALDSLSVRAQNQGVAGNITLNTASLSLNDYARIIAESSSGTGGSIFIGTQPNTPQFADFTTISPNITLLRNNSLISATAGDNQNPGDGGNININTPFLIGFPNKNTDIIANAFSGTGGQINITANNLFNFEVASGQTETQLQSNTTNDISASSQLGNSGIVTLNTIDIDPAESLAELPSDVIDASSLIDNSLCAIGNKSEFIVTGRGGLPTSPTDALSNASGWEDWNLNELESSVSSSQLPSSGSAPQRTQAEPSISSSPLVEAKRWSRTAQGNVVLHAAVPAPSQQEISSCRQLRQHLSSH